MVLTSHVGEFGDPERENGVKPEILKGPRMLPKPRSGSTIFFG